MQRTLPGLQLPHLKSKVARHFLDHGYSTGLKEDLMEILQVVKKGDLMKISRL
jgi:hypothetical protein